MTIQLMRALITGALVVSIGVQADDTPCTGQLSGNYDNVVVPAGATCQLTDARLEGNVKVEPNGALILSGRTFIQGNVQSEDGGRYVRILGPSVRIGGNIQIKKNYEASAIQPGATIEGNVQYEDNSGSLFAAGAFIGGDLQAFKNTGGLTLTRNTIRQNLQCKENAPAPTGSANSAGSKEDQCRGL